ncbi:unnamed protein product, partial [Mesorhabditis belari]|uniref:Tr-type G domain-containing protein n=1 Tax=Mesorhabditis belari TaxID=2138241 RepID=A0AAF3FEV7_9BILA
MNYEDEFSQDEDDDQDFLLDDENYAMSPSASQFMYRRQRLSSTNSGVVQNVPKLMDFIPDDIDKKHDEMFQFEDDVKLSYQDIPPPPGLSLKPGNLPPSGFGPSTSQGKPPATVKPIGFSITRIGEPMTQPMEEVEKPKPFAVEKLKASEPGKRSSSKSPSRQAKADGWEPPKGLTPNASSHRLSQLAAISSAPATPKRQRRRDAATKELVNLVVVGHVDAGKSTLMGHILCKLNFVDQKTIHKYKQESSRQGKASFAFAWVLDETDEERNRGITMDIARTFFETKHRRIVLLDAPGHRDFIPNMITGASQADAALLVVNANIGEFESGFDKGGQTREHAMLLRSLGVSQLIVAVNQLDKVEWSQDRYKDVESQIKVFLERTAGFTNIKFVPCSGLSGENLIERPNESCDLRKWYNGPCLIELIDELQAPKRVVDGPLRAIINDIFKSTSTSLSVSVKVESGEIQVNDKLYIMPNADQALVKAVTNDDGGASDCVYAGDQALLTLFGAFEPDTIHPGHVLTSGGKDALMPGRRFMARIVVFDIPIPIMKGTKAELFCHSLCEPVTFVKLVSEISKNNGKVLKERPRCLARNKSGMVVIETERDVAIEPYTVCKPLGRITIRLNGQTIAAGIIESRTD